MITTMVLLVVGVMIAQAIHVNNKRGMGKEKISHEIEAGSINTKKERITI